MRGMWLILALLVPGVAAADQTYFRLEKVNPVALEAREFRRLLDVGVEPRANPAACVDVHVTRHVEAGGCLSTQRLAENFSVGGAWRKNVFFLPSIGERIFTGPLELSAGAGASLSHTGSSHRWEVGPRLSAEAVAWWKPHIGLTAQLELGLDFDTRTGDPDPYGRTTVGMAF